MYYGNPSCSSQQFPARVWDSNYAVVLHMSDATTSTVDDSTSNLNIGYKYIANDPQESQEGKIHKCQQHNSNNNYLRLNDDSSLDIGTGDTTMEIWLKTTSNLWEQFGTLLIEEYVEGREFNASLLGYPQAKLLPVAEIDFSAFPANLYSIVGYRAKWDERSFEYHHTPRKFDPDMPPGLHDAIANAAVECFRLFMLRDYARVDLRVNARGRVYVLEVNANPCLSPDAGFAAASEKAGISYTRLVD